MDADGFALLSLTHAGNVYPGSVDRAGHFSTPARVVGGNHGIAITGQFSANGFDATAAHTLRAAGDD
jgi:hypothetical protein